MEVSQTFLCFTARDPCRLATASAVVYNSRRSTCGVVVDDSLFTSE